MMLTYKNGYPFSDPLPRDLDNLKKRIKGKKASMIVIDGGVGEGKTTLAVQIAKTYQGGKFNLQKQYAIGGDQFQEKLIMCYDSGLIVIIYDEAGDFNTRGALTSFNQMLNRVFDTFRAFEILVILVLPSFHVLDSPLFDKRIPRMLIHCLNRTGKSGNFKVYSLYRMYYLRDKIKKYIVPGFAYSGTTANYRGHFLDLPKKESEELAKISIEGKKQIVSQGILKNKGLVNYNDIARKTNRSVIWVRRKVSELNISAVQKYKKSKYFNKEVIDLLKDHL